MSLQLGGFPLVVASKRGLLSAVRVLLVNGTDVNQRTKVSCLLYCTHFDTGSGGSGKCFQVKCVYFVVQAGHTGLMLASLKGRTDVVATLLSAPGVLVDSADNKVCAHERVGRSLCYRCW